MHGVFSDTMMSVCKLLLQVAIDIVTNYIQLPFNDLLFAYHLSDFAILTLCRCFFVLLHILFLIPAFAL